MSVAVEREGIVENLTELEELGSASQLRSRLSRDQVVVALCSTVAHCEREMELEQIRDRSLPMLVMNLLQHLTTVTRKAACCEDGRSVSYLYDLPLMTKVNSRGCITNCEEESARRPKCSSRLRLSETYMQSTLIHSL